MIIQKQIFNYNNIQASLAHKTIMNNTIDAIIEDLKQ